MWRNRGLLGPPTGRSFRPLGAQHTAAYSGAGQGQRVGQRIAETIGRRREAEGRGGARWGQLRLLPGFRPRRLGQSGAPLSRRQHLPLPRTTRCGPRRSEAWPNLSGGSAALGDGGGTQGKARARRRPSSSPPPRGRQPRPLEPSQGTSGSSRHCPARDTRAPTGPTACGAPEDTFFASPGRLGPHPEGIRGEWKPPSFHGSPRPGME